MGAIQCRLKVLSGQPAILTWVAVLDVQQHKVERREPGVVEIRMQRALGIKRHMYRQLRLGARTTESAEKNRETGKNATNESGNWRGSAAGALILTE